jgi:outer membrane protein
VLEWRPALLLQADASSLTCYDLRLLRAAIAWVSLTAIASSETLTLSAAVEAALKNYPSLRVSEENIKAASAGIQLARTAYLPKLDALAQFNRATRNNVFGLMLPQSVIPSISGPVIGSNNFGTVWGSAIGVLVSWEPFDFGMRRASVEAAEATRLQTEAARKRTRFEIASMTADGFLTLAATEQTVKAAQAGVTRAEALLKIIRALVSAELRPGADQSRAEAELAAARTQMIQARQAVAIARVNLNQFTGELGKFELSLGELLRTAPAPTPLQADANPLVIEQVAAIEQTRLRLRVLERSYFPKFQLQGSAYARGTGAELNGDRLGLANGLAPNVQNYALGLTVTFSAGDLPAIRAKEAAEAAHVRAETARKEQLINDLRAQWNRATAMVEGARQVALNTPQQVAAARAAVDQATARYQAGLGAISEVAEAERLLAQSEIDDALAHLAVWRGLLGVAMAAGDLEPFIVEASH